MDRRLQDAIKSLNRAFNAAQVPYAVADGAARLALGGYIAYAYNFGPASRLPSVQKKASQVSKALGGLDFEEIAESATKGSKVAAVARAGAVLDRTNFAFTLGAEVTYAAARSTQ
ncbi:hypothetical protein [Ciceribacter sp. RN22]|uniref:hypothetical protein n=1 Tax=Ciceribacter sp. RN22 TaxID=2954932 RepID=UPI002093F34A|nr:hypothetical protein [Ciceribacter sp. RN22]MCO6178436.1 hypothetical protein [Ciceribacter sp. RN22]